MLKKVFVTAVFTALILLGSTAEKVSAQDVWVGTSPATGWQCYVMTETARAINDASVEVTLKMVKKSGNVEYLHYVFWTDYVNGTFFKNSQGFSGVVDQYKTPIEYNAMRVAFRYGDRMSG